MSVYRAVLDEFYNKPTKLIRDGSTRDITYDCSIGRDSGEMLYNCVREIKPTDILEIGLAWGGSAIHIASAVKDNGFGHHLALDPGQSDYSYIGADSVARIGFENAASGSLLTFDCIERRSDYVLPELAEAKKSFQFIFVDGDHSFHGLFVDLHYCEKILEVGGILIFDDSGSEPMKKLMRYIGANLDNLEFRGEHHGRFAAYKKIHPDTRKEWIYNDF